MRCEATSGMTGRDRDRLAIRSIMLFTLPPVGQGEILLVQDGSPVMIHGRFVTFCQYDKDACFAGKTDGDKF